MLCKRDDDRGENKVDAAGAAEHTNCVWDSKWVVLDGIAQRKIGHQAAVY